MDCWDLGGVQSQPRASCQNLKQKSLDPVTSIGNCQKRSKTLDCKILSDPVTSIGIYQKRFKHSLKCIVWIWEECNPSQGLPFKILSRNL